MTETPILDERAVEEIEAMFPNAEYQPTLSPDEVDPCEFCKGTIDDHKAGCVVPHVHALCATVKHLRTDNEGLKRTADIRYPQVVELREQLAQVKQERDRASAHVARLHDELVDLQQFRTRAIQLCKARAAEWEANDKAAMDVSGAHSKRVYAAHGLTKAEAARELANEIEKL